MPPEPDAGIRVGDGLGAQCGGCFAGHAAGGEALYVAQKQRDDFMVLDDFQQILPNEGLDWIAVSCFLRPAKTCQHELKFAIHRLMSIMLDVRVTAKSQRRIIRADHWLWPGGCGICGVSRVGLLPSLSATTVTAAG